MPAVGGGGAGASLVIPGMIRVGNTYLNLNIIPRIDINPTNGTWIAHYQTNYCDTSSDPAATTALQSALDTVSTHVS